MYEEFNELCVAIDATVTHFLTLYVSGFSVCLTMEFINVSF